MAYVCRREPDLRQLVKTLAWAFRFQCTLDEGLHSSITDMAEAERLERG
jgi:hypothetical protein